MKELKEIELKPKLVNELKIIDEFCNKYNLTYFLMYGTLLGAVRHNGFIPWDDDIDIVMPRKDYEIFVKTFNSFNKNYSVIDCFSNKKYYLPWAKVIDNNTILIEKIDIKCNIGLYIDVFPLDNVPDDIKINNRLIKQINRLNAIRNYKYMTYNKNVIKNIAKFCLKFLLLPFSINYICRKSEKLSKKYNDENTSDVSIICWMLNSKLKFPKELFSKSCEIKFEDYYFKCPIGYDVILKIRYGNYMELPPVEQRVKHHSFEVFIKD